MYRYVPIPDPPSSHDGHEPAVADSQAESEAVELPALGTLEQGTGLGAVP